MFGLYLLLSGLDQCKSCRLVRLHLLAEAGNNSMILKSVPCSCTLCLLLLEVGRVGSIERIYKGFARCMGWLIILDFGEKGVYAFYTLGCAGLHVRRPHCCDLLSNLLEKAMNL